MDNLARFPSLRVNLAPGDSALAASMFDDASVDFLFIDADHSYEAVKADWSQWFPKVKRNGYIALHDAKPVPPPGY